MAPLAPPNAPRSSYPSGVALASWALYDLANTIFSAIVITRYFIPYMDKRGTKEIVISAALITAMFAAGIASPYAGMIMDRVGRGRLLLFASTLGCVVFTAVMGLPLEGHWLLAAFVGANFFYNVALVFYNAFLPYLGPPRVQGRISGLGVGLGYVGLIPAIFAAALLRERFGGDQVVFPFAALAFFALAIPAFIALPSIPAREGSAPRSSPWKAILENAREIWRGRETRLYFLGNFLFTDVLNALILWVFVYVQQVYGLTEKEKDLYQVYLVVSNIAASFLAGWLSDRWTARKTFILSGACLLLALVAAGLLPAGAKGALYWTTVPLAGFGLGGIWTAGRHLLFRLSPPGRLGEYSGFYGLTGKVSSFTTLIYGAIASWGGPGAHRAAVLTLAAPVAIGIWLTLRMKEPEGAEG